MGEWGSGKSSWPRKGRFPRFTNEVQHQSKVLAWSTNSCLPMSGFGLPTYKPQERRSGKLLQLWIARHRRWLGS